MSTRPSINPARSSRSRSPLWGSRGNALIEFAFVLPVLFALVVGGFEFGRLFYLRLTIHNAVQEASRFTVTGNVLPDPDNPGESLSRVESIIHRLSSAAPGVNLSPTNIEIVGPKGSGDPGGPGDVVTIRVEYDIDLITPVVKPLFPGGTHRYSVAVVSQNEPF